MLRASNACADHKQRYVVYYDDSPWYQEVINSLMLRNYECTSYLLYAAFKGSSPVIMDGQAGADECMELENTILGRDPSLLAKMHVSKPVSCSITNAVSSMNSLIPMSYCCETDALWLYTLLSSSLTIHFSTD